MGKIANLEAKVRAALAAALEAGEPITIEHIAAKVGVVKSTIRDHKLNDIILAAKANIPSYHEVLEAKVRAALAAALEAGEPITIEHIAAKVGVGKNTIHSHKLNDIIQTTKANVPSRYEIFAAKIRSAITEALAADEPITIEHIAAKAGVSMYAMYYKYKLNDIILAAKANIPSYHEVLEAKVRAALAAAVTAGQPITSEHIAAKAGVDIATIYRHKLNDIIQAAKPQPQPVQQIDLSASPYPPIPSTTDTLYNHSINTAADIWYIPTHAYSKSQKSINWRIFTSLSPEALHVLRLYTLHLLTTRKPKTVVAQANLLRRFDLWLSQRALTHSTTLLFQWASLDEELFRDYSHHCQQTFKSKGTYPNALRTFYRWGAHKEYPGFSSTTYKRLKQIKLQYHQHGKAVLYNDPTYGPFSPDEHHQIVKAILAEIGTPLQRVIAMLLFELGIRPGVLPLLKNKHLTKYGDSTSTKYFLNVPRFKKASTANETIRRPIDAPLAHLLYTLQGDNPEEPLITALNVKNPGDPIRRQLHQWAKYANLRSRNSQNRLNISPTRFRRSLATRMLAHGATIQEVAKILDHSSAETAWIYTQASSVIAQKANQATAPAMSANQALWEGQVAFQEDQQAQAYPATPGFLVAPTTAPITLAHGKCGLSRHQQLTCRHQTGLECYGCADFIALASGPHEQIRASVALTLSQLQEESDPHVTAYYQDKLVQIDHVITKANQIRGIHEPIHTHPTNQQPITLELPTPHPSPARV